MENIPPKQISHYNTEETPIKFNRDLFYSDTFYHWTKKSTVGIILEEGLIPSTLGPDYDEPRLYITDDSESSFGEICIEIDWSDELLDLLEEDENVIEIVGCDYTVYIRCKKEKVVIPKKFLKIKAA